MLPLRKQKAEDLAVTTGGFRWEQLRCLAGCHEERIVPLGTATEILVHADAAESLPSERRRLGSL
jgi:hypothetical protein